MTRDEANSQSFPTRRQALAWFAAAAASGAVSSSPLASWSGQTSETSAGGVRPAPGLPEPIFVGANGVRLAVYDTEGDGPAIVLNHGFPELAFSWRHQIKALSAAGYRVIAPDQRGYGLSERPAKIEDYTLQALCDDMAGMLDALELDKAVFCGHDWGGGVAWMMPRFHPDRVAGVIGVNTPTSHPAKPRPTPDEEPLIVRTENYYTRTFQEPGRAEKVLERDVRATFEFLMRRGGIWNVEAFRALPKDSAARQLDLLRMLEEGNPTGELLLTKEELDYFVETFSATGFTGGLNWYRAVGQLPPGDMSNVVWDISVPALYVGADNDVVLPPSSADGMESFIADLEKKTVTDCGHWTQQEKPAELNKILLDWLGRKFPV